jgi:pimeloyl-ACP methyl ester carboxylesterase
LIHHQFVTQVFIGGRDMSATVYALLVGIDAYRAPVPTLHGCKNDVRAIQAYLQERARHSQSFQLEALLLEDAQATRQALIAGFRNHLAKAGPDDVVLFYYSGHGSQEPTPPEFVTLEPDGLDETLVLFDSRDPGQFDLADKELTKLIKEVADRAGHVAVILDCCHSGSGTRALDEDGIATRRAPMDQRMRPASSFLFTASELAGADDQPAERALSASGWSGLAQGKHVLLAACRSSETAKETQIDGQPRGAFSAALMAALRGIGPEATYSDLVKRASAQVRSMVQQQTPQLEALGKAKLETNFLGGAVPARGPYFTLMFDPVQGWVIDGGAVHGVRMNSVSETTTLAVFGLESQVEDWQDLNGALATLEVTQVLPELSKVNVKPTGAALEKITYRAIVTGQPVPALGVWLTGDAAGVTLAREAMLNARGAGLVSLFVREATSQDDATFRLHAEANHFRITRAGSQRRLGQIVTDVQGFDPEGSKKVTARLEHMARWQLTSQLENPGSRLGNAIELKVSPVPSPPEPWPDTGEVKLEQTSVEAPEYTIRLKNTANKPLYCALLYLDESYGVHTDLMQGEWLKPGEEAFAFGGDPISSWVPDDWYDAGITEVHDRVKLIVSTAEFDATLLAQPELDVALEKDSKAVTRGITNTLSLLMERNNTRAGGTRPGDTTRFADWATNDLPITTVRLLEGRAIPNATGQSIALGPNVTLAGHGSLSGQARLTSLPQAARDLENRTVPTLLSSDPNGWQPWSFTASRGGDPGLGALELNDVQHAEQVTPENPLRLHVAGTNLADGESVLATAWDPTTQLFLPLGIAVQEEDGISINLERLPTPAAINQRSLAGSIQILFQKFIAQTLGTEFPYPLLRAATVNEAGQVTYSRPDEVASLAQHAKNILLFIHGIIGDTESMVPCVHPKRFGIDLPAMTDGYDLILTFDYENINDGIEKAANGLKACLEKAGLNQKRDGRSLKIVAHSMGGLISRWYIEKLGGNTAIDKLVMLGTPNAGSPWPNVQAWATGMLGVGLNALGTGFWPVRIIGGLLGLIEKVDTNLDEMTPGSGILKALADPATPDPGVPYIIIAGDVTQNTEKQAVLERLLKRLGTVALFSSQPNDIAVLNSSIVSVNTNRNPKPLTPASVACDHMSYFGSVEGIQALEQALRG